MEVPGPAEEGKSKGQSKAAVHGNGSLPGMGWHADKHAMRCGLAPKRHQ